MNDQQQELITKLKDANNILVTVSANPSVDQLAACIGLTILLNKLKKHATAVFSGNVPNTIDFLKPEDTLERNTDSLRDFIIALDKSKADKLRYKVEENIVKIFITPYKTSISQNDLDFSQGDFNVDVVLALGVHEQQDLDQAITAHGRILHDAVVVSVNTAPGSELGVINWTVPTASSLSELSVAIVDALAKDLMDGQIATALLTGIVAETERFSNEKTSPETMRLSAELMAAGANQQLVASELQQPGDSMQVRGSSTSQNSGDSAEPKADDGTLEIMHPGEETESPQPPSKPPVEQPPDVADEPVDTPESPEQASSSMPLLPPSELTSPHRIVEPPAMGGALTANTQSEDAGAFGGLPQHEPDLPIMEHDIPAQPKADDAPLTMPEIIVKPQPQASDVLPDDDTTFKLPELELPTPVPEPADTAVNPAPESPATQVADEYTPLDSEPAATTGASPASTSSPTPASDETLAALERSIHSPHAQSSADPASSVDSARGAVLDAINSVPAAEQPLAPKADVGAGGYLNVQDLPGIAHDQPASAMPQPSGPLVNPVPLPPSPPPAFNESVAQPVPYVPEPTPGSTPADTPLTMPLPPGLTPPPANPTPPTSAPSNPSAPPPVPPPMTELPPFVNPSQP